MSPTKTFPNKTNCNTDAKNTRLDRSRASNGIGYLSCWCPLSRLMNYMMVKCSLPLSGLSTSNTCCLARSR
ncbi:hypothetical protein POPTR_011G033200v4 [Populus trichocarpa]|uniref:Uncharacterized protein n=1 Tax=Populus trichocarpa TaxID=3694 RepID=A0A2K1YF08_POPTR|nr:hypothetical protein BDE02_11G026900 [Populus trichocarpa]PNT11614.1 hypothetical protein POPTR_011G033200v4 [Populus trichocarpa]